jgi:hypothetical protein
MKYTFCEMLNQIFFFIQHGGECLERNPREINLRLQNRHQVKFRNVSTPIIVIFVIVILALELKLWNQTQTHMNIHRRLLIEFLCFTTIYMDENNFN